ncbi:hypothetical protein ElyMa_005819400 [Elysia marginata]|uniref:Uncharacterized protein n=1 Tax=Elysia marginata TaxID=1093978 RepID=A0AAV4FW78_9GAST|nr:hypothetical protein ElyMa_005819400 [Elysia marginata]
MVFTLSRAKGVDGDEEEDGDDYDDDDEEEEESGDNDDDDEEEEEEDNDDNDDEEEEEEDAHFDIKTFYETSIRSSSNKIKCVFAFKSVFSKR